MKKRNNTKKAAVIAVLIFIIGFFLGGYISPVQMPETKPQVVYAEKTILPNTTSVSLKVPAVDQDGKGIATNLYVQAVEGGSGKVLVNVDKLLFWIDTQYSIQVARSVAQNMTGKNLSKYDLIYTIDAETGIVEGGSAGAALTIATIAALDKMQLKNDIMITGTINPDGTIGPIGGVQEKADAAKNSGMKTFLIPSANRYEYKYKTEQQCEAIPGGRFCTVVTVPVKEQVVGDGVEVQQVESIEDALQYFRV